MPDDIEEVTAMTEDTDPTPRPTPEEEEEWERQRKEAWEAKIRPFRNFKKQVNEHDDLMADALYELTLLELGMEV